LADRTILKQGRKMKVVCKIIFSVLALLLISGCAITHQYGPYMGQVVDKETNEPLEGAVVFLRIFTEYPTPGGPVSVFADALEVMTDKAGEFTIPSHRVWSFRPVSWWDKVAHAIVFKPGYGAFPGHIASDLSKWKAYEYNNNGMPDDEHFTVILPKLKTREERAKNVSSNATFTTEIPLKKWQNLFELRNVECNKLGIEPWPRP